MFESPTFLEFQKQLLGATDDDFNIILKEFNKNPSDLHHDIDTIRDWLKKTPHLAHIEPHDRQLKRFLGSTGFSVEKTKAKLDAYYTTKFKYPEIFTKRDDTLDPAISKSMEAVHYCALPVKDKNNFRVSINRFANKNADLYDVLASLKLMLMIAEIRAHFETNSGEVVIFDMEYTTFNHVIKITPYVKMMFIIMQDNYPSRIKEIHFLNAPPAAQGVIELLKTMLKEKILKRLYFHKDIESLCQCVSPDLLPSDFGGKQASFEEIKNNWKRALFSPEWKKWFLETENAKSDESKRPANGSSQDTFGVAGTFKRINLD